MTEDFIQQITLIIIGGIITFFLAKGYQNRKDVKEYKRAIFETFIELNDELYSMVEDFETIKYSNTIKMVKIKN